MTASMYQAERDVCDLTITLAKRHAAAERGLSAKQREQRDARDAAWLDTYEQQLCRQLGAQVRPPSSFSAPSHWRR
jgi:hypothetical protein